MSRTYQRVRRVTQSPLNPLRWALDLECGHELWVTQKKRPALVTVETERGEKMVSARTMRCRVCEES